MKLPAFSALLLVVSCSSPNSPRSVENTERQMIGLLEKFDRFDYNGDGYLTRKEILDGAAEAELGPIDPERFERAFNFYDTNGDGRISLAEANAGLHRGPDALAH